MKFETSDGKFVVDIKGSRFKMSLSSGDFQMEGYVHQLPPKLDELRKSLSNIVSKIETVASLIRRGLND